MRLPSPTRPALLHAHSSDRSPAVSSRCAWLLESSYAADHWLQRACYRYLSARTWVYPRSKAWLTLGRPPSFQLITYFGRSSATPTSGGSLTFLPSAGTIYEQSIGLSSTNSRILAACNGTAYFAASWIPMFLIERLGVRAFPRKKRHQGAQADADFWSASASDAHDLWRVRPVSGDGPSHCVSFCSSSSLNPLGLFSLPACLQHRLPHHRARRLPHSGQGQFGRGHRSSRSPLPFQFVLVSLHARLLTSHALVSTDCCLPAPSDGSE